MITSKLSTLASICLASICLMVLLCACVLPASHSPTLQPQNIARTSAAETIAAQLTAIVNPGSQATGEVSPAAGMSTPNMLIPSETLPATSTPLPTNSPIPSYLPFPSPTIQSTTSITQTSNSLISALGEPAWKDGFQDGTNWPLYDDSHILMEIVEGKLQMTALIPNQENPWDGWMVSQPYLDDFYLAVSASTGECSGLDRYGLLARATPNANRSYLFGFSCGGQYSLRIWNGSDFKMLIDWTPSDYIFSGSDQTNQLGFKAEGTKLSLFANGDLLTELEDDTFSEGAFGLFVGAVNTSGFTVLFDDMAYWVTP